LPWPPADDAATLHLAKAFQSRSSGMSAAVTVFE
jgi:hypothetical protein